MKRILLIGAIGTGTLEGHFDRAFRRLGHDVHQYDAQAAALQWIWRSRVLSRATWDAQHLLVNRSMRTYFAAHRDWDLVIVFKGTFISPDAIAHARAATRDAVWMCLNPDSPFEESRASSSRHVRRCIPLYDAYLIWSRALLAPLRAAGCKRPEYLPFGYDLDEHFAPPQQDPSLADRFAFVGTYDRQRQQVMEALSDLPVQVYGGGWQAIGRRSRLASRVVPTPLYREQLRRVIGSAAGVINILRPQNEGSHNMRTFEVPAMGGLLITNRTPEQQEVFPEGEASLMYDGLAELRAVLEGLAEGRYDADAIRRRGKELVAPHSYDARASQILRIAEAGRT